MPKGYYKNGEAMLPPSRKGAKHTPQAKEKNRIKHLGKRHTDETRKKISLISKKPNTGQFKKGHTIRNPKQFKKGENVGEKNNAWKGGVTTENHKIRTSKEYKLWRTAVFERDGYKCIWCGNNKSGNLNADHIKPFALYPELRFAIDNGRTLCVPCHKTTDFYLNNKIKL